MILFLLMPVLNFYLVVCSVLNSGLFAQWFDGCVEIGCLCKVLALRQPRGVSDVDCPIWFVVVVQVL